MFGLTALPYEGVSAAFAVTLTDISIAMDAMPATAPLRTADLRIVLCILSASIVCWLIWNRFCCRPTVRFRPLKDNENHLRLMNSSFCNVPIFRVFRL